MLKADLHIHTQYSMDCDTPLEKIVSRCLALGINCIAIADHGTTEGALKMAKIAPFPVIVAEEMLTRQGEIMGMFLRETIPSGLSVTETVERIREQGALVCAQHPFDTVLRHGLGSKLLEELAGEIDIIEVLNARSPLPQSSKKALRFAGQHALPGSAGSDAHSLGEIGNAYVKMPEFTDRADFLKTLARGKVIGHLSGPMVHFHGLGQRLRNIF